MLQIGDRVAVYVGDEEIGRGLVEVLDAPPRAGGAGVCVRGDDGSWFGGYDAEDVWVLERNDNDGGKGQ